jgi:cytochrome P450
MGEGRTFAFSLPLLPSSIMVTDLACLEHVLKRHCHNYPKGPRFFLNFGPVLGHGIFTSDGDDWYWQRKLATHIFSVKRCARSSS